MSSHIEAINQRVEGMAELFAELNRITSGTTITKAQEARAAALQAQISALKSGLTPTELAEAHMHSLRKELGMSEYALRNTPRLQTRAVQEWREFLTGDKTELRTNDESTAQWGNVTGQSYSSTQGAQFVPASYDRRVFASLGTFDEVVLDEFSNVWESDKLSAATTPTWDDVVGSGSPVSYAFNKSTNLGQAEQTSVVPTKSSRAAWGECPQWKTGRFQLAFELEQDTFEPTVRLLEKVINQRHALAFGAYAVANIVNALPTVQNVTSAASTLVLSDFTAVIAALPHAYRKNGVILMNDATKMFLIGQLLETNNRPAIEGLKSFLGLPIAVCDTLAVGGVVGNAGNDAVVLVADPTYLLQRRVPKHTYVRRYVQSAVGIEFGMANVEGWMAADFQPLNFDSELPPIAVLNQHS
jgi:HK97 family phage major capsid protein